MKLRIRKIIFSCFCFVMTGIPVATLAQHIPSSKQQIKAALAAAPKAMRKDAKVYGYTQEGKWTTLRKGHGKLICIADNPMKPKFHVACYYRALEPFMKRGRELRAKGMSHKAVDEERRKEIKSGKLKWPHKPMGLYNLSGPKGAFDYQTATLEKANPLYVVYIPFSTEKTTGITTSPAGPGGPWLMEAGEPWSHIMIPGRPVGEKAQQK